MMSLLAVLFPAVTAPVARTAPVRSRATLLLLAVALVNAALALALGVSPLTREARVLLGGFFVVDATSRLFLLLINLVFFGIATYVWTRVRNEPALHASIGRYVAFALAFIAASNLSVLSNHLIVGWVFLEATTLAAVPLITLGRSARGLNAAWKYFLFSGVGLTLAFLGFVCLARSMELSGVEVTFALDRMASFAAMPRDVWRNLGLMLVFLGFGTKLGLAPMFSWLPETYDAAPPATTALLAAVQFNVALVGVLRVLQVFRVSEHRLVSVELVVLGLGTMAASAVHIIASRNYKRLIAYASLNHGGVIAIGLGVGAAAAYGVVVYVVSNALIKAILFLTAGKIKSHYKTDDMREVSGLIKDLPYSGIFFMVGTFALLGLPPFGSFLGELIIMSGLVSGGFTFVFTAFCLILTVTFIATGRSMFPMIWGEPKRKVNWASQPFASIVPKLVFLTGLVAMGIYLPAPLNSLFRQVAASLGAP